MNPPLYSNRGHANALGHFQVISVVANHNRVFRLDSIKANDFFKHGWIWFRASFVGAAGDIKILTQATCCQSLSQPPATFSRSNRATHTGTTNISHNVCHACEYVLWCCHFSEEVLSIALSNGHSLFTTDIRIKYFQRLNHPQANYIPIRLPLPNRITKFQGCMVKALRNMLHGIYKRSVPVKNNSLELHYVSLSCQARFEFFQHVTECMIIWSSQMNRLTGYRQCEFKSISVKHQSLPTKCPKGLQTYIIHVLVITGYRMAGPNTMNSYLVSPARYR